MPRSTNQMPQTKQKNDEEVYEVKPRIKQFPKKNGISLKNRRFVAKEITNEKMVDAIRFDLIHFVFFFVLFWYYYLILC